MTPLTKTSIKEDEVDANHLDSREMVNDICLHLQQLYKSTTTKYNDLKLERSCLPKKRLKKTIHVCRLIIQPYT